MSIIVTQAWTGDVETTVEQMSARLRHELSRRSYLAANELRNAALDVLRGQRGGRRYRVPGTQRYYSASSPGEPPAARTGIFRLSWQPRAYVEGDTFVSAIESKIRVGKKGYLLGQLLEDGTTRMAARPHHDRILEKAENNIVTIYGNPYNL